MANQVLNIGHVEQDFFADSKLMAIGTRLPGYALCSLLNSLFAVNLVKDEDVVIYHTPSNNTKVKARGSLFENLLPSPDSGEQTVRFNLFRFVYDTRDDEDISLLIYQNRQEGHHLMPELPQADFLILIQNRHRIRYESDISPHLKYLKEIEWVSELIPYDLKYRSNLLL